MSHLGDYNSFLNVLPNSILSTYSFFFFSRKQPDHISSVLKTLQCFPVSLGVKDSVLIVAYRAQTVRPWCPLWPHLQPLSFSLHFSCTGLFFQHTRYIPIWLGEPTGTFSKYLQGSPPHFLQILSHAVLSRRPSLTTLFKTANYLC